MTQIDQKPFRISDARLREMIRAKQLGFIDACSKAAGLPSACVITGMEFHFNGDWDLVGVVSYAPAADPRLVAMRLPQPDPGPGDSK